ncbi:MAG: heat-inducible transcription repressor HrcA [Tissierellia bacterium]|nr:heat-inducible transcription repressor HrcA [Tissierellia bacterium]
MLDERKMKILQAIIDSYIELAEPVGSRTLSKKYDLGISSATIRNEMSDLEELGFLNKPHASAGRIPSDKAYRLYVDTFMESSINLNDDILKSFKDQLTTDVNDYFEILNNASKLLSKMTNYTSITVSPVATDTKLKMLKLVRVDEYNIILIVVGNRGDVENYIFVSRNEITDENIDKTNSILNNMLVDKTVDEIRSVEILLDDYKENKDLMDFVIKSVKKFLNKHNDIEVFSSGIANIVDFVEYDDVDTVKNFFDFFEDKDNLIDVIFNEIFEDTISIRIGSENENESMKNYSVISAKYMVGDSTHGNISIIGPKRMDYANLIRTLMMFSINLSDLSKIL